MRLGKLNCLCASAIAALGLSLASCTSDKPAKSEASRLTAREAAATPKVQPPPVAATRPADYPGLHNVVTFADGLYSGSAPEGDKAFTALAGMGVKTIISVDGAAPDVEAAKKLGMRYVHLPIGYNGIDTERTLELSRAVRDLPGPVYIHCHHGKHRCAGAAGAVAVTLDLMTNDEAIERMMVSGTAPSYPGLFQSVRVASVAPKAELDATSNAFPSKWKTTGLVQSMVEADDVFDHLRLIEKADWKTPADHPDLVPAAEAGRMADLLRNLGDDTRVKAKPQEFRKMMADNAKLASSLEEALVRGGVPAQELSAKFKMVGQSCNDCHVKYRN